MYKSEIEGDGGIYAKVVCDSIANDIRLTTMELHYPRFIHSEFMTHRMFSRNASSSRAIPVEKMLASIEASPAMPIHWGKNQPGMQAREECAEEVHIGGQYWDGYYTTDRGTRESLWEMAASDAAYHANSYADAGYHKQIVNRLTEPFQFIKVVVTATEWENFFNLRLHPDAQPEIQELARVMKEAMKESTPTVLYAGMWHLPYTDQYALEPKDPSGEDGRKVSVARCARVSYMNHDTTSPDIEKDIALHDQLLASGHMSPFEHVACPMNSLLNDSSGHYLGWDDGTTHMDKTGGFWSSNFRGWVMYRNLL